MNQDLPQVKTVKLLFIALDEQQQAMFKMAFKMHSTTNYQIVDAASGDKPELVIVDADNANGLSLWQKAKGDYSGSVVVYFSKSPPPITAPYLAKPIKFDTLFISLRNLLQGNGVWVVHSDSQTTSSAPVVDRHVVSNHHRANEVTIPRFDPHHGLLGAFRKAVENQKDVAILVGEKPILAVFPSTQRVWVAVDSVQLKKLCREDNLEIKLKNIAEDSSVHERVNATITSSMWQIALWTANGRLVQPINPNTVFKLGSWPNLTRLAPLPESMRLSAFLTKTPVSLNMLYKLMPLDMRDILNYIAATYLTDYLIIVQQQQDVSPRGHSTISVASQEKRSEQIQATRPVAQQQSGGLLSRLMKKLLNK